VTDGLYAYLGPETRRGTLVVSASRRAFCNRTAPPAHVTVGVGPAGLDEQQKPYLPRATLVRRFVVQNCTQRAIEIPARPPFAVTVRVSPRVRPSDFGGSDARDLGAIVGWSFTPTH
jgi:hypothetical protein